jgi:hypothetical protein
LVEPPIGSTEAACPNPANIWFDFDPTPCDAMADRFVQRTWGGSRMDTDEFVISRLRQVLRRHKEELRGWPKLSQEIHEVNDCRADSMIGRKTLAALCGDDFGVVKLSILQMIALDRYFVATNEGPLFVRTECLVDAIAESSEVAFYLAGRYHRDLDTEAVSAFDVRAFAKLLTTRLGRGKRVRMFDVVDADEWRTANEGSGARANVAIGSPVASHASDRVMSKMLGFDVTSKTPIEQLPFFIVRRSNEKRFKSGFLRKKLSALSRNAGDVERISDEQRAFVFEKQVFVGTDDVDYSLLLAQRNPDGGQVCAVLAGLTGLATRELASLLQAGAPMSALPELRAGEKHPPILAVIYKHTLEGGRSKSRNGAREMPTVAGSVPVMGPVLLHFTEGAWRTLA